MEVTFQAFPKLQRLNGPVIITEKIDGTNGCIIIQGNEIAAQSRTRIITPEKDNFGFALWVYDNAGKLIELLGDGYHYGEWWGKGIQRGYNMPRRVFSLFNTSRWIIPENEAKWGNYDLNNNNIGLAVVPALHEGIFDTNEFQRQLDRLSKWGSFASPGFMSPEGICIYDTRSGQGYKKTFDYDDTGKGGTKDEHGNVLKGK